MVYKPGGHEQISSKRKLERCKSVPIKMSQRRPERASKTKATEMIANMFDQPLPETEDCPLKLTFRRELWNACAPAPQSKIASPQRPNPEQPPKPNPTPVSTQNADTSNRSPAPRHCKVKVSRFQYGGPFARVAGKSKNTITRETPCLRPTCASCCKWHAHLLRSPVESPAPLTNTPECVRATGTRRLRITLRHCARLKFASGRGKAAFEALVHERVMRQVRGEGGGVLGREVRRCVAEEGWTPRRRYRVRLVFGTERGRRGFGGLVGRCL
ncbi:hypothetical protein C7974DRAFT_25769 [Boeremia exigua]|uniref:uncharacterized protein n=1 Tax=Boeremia exigua TaxID=749465 RepID=UPI001E8EBACD|nr:uncharacterized protein C7974DRAFT_25769 [Boeremia exigua]KAH6644666.1 hypothetical protein C7974DRAFT_25769 [Boeremia exigua]